MKGICIYEGEDAFMKGRCIYEQGKKLVEFLKALKIRCFSKTKKFLEFISKNKHIPENLEEQST